MSLRMIETALSLTLIGLTGGPASPATIEKKDGQTIIGDVQGVIVFKGREAGGISRYIIVDGGAIDAMTRQGLLLRSVKAERPVAHLLLSQTASGSKLRALEWALRQREYNPGAAAFSTDIVLVPLGLGGARSARDFDPRQIAQAARDLRGEKVGRLMERAFEEAKALQVLLASQIPIGEYRVVNGAGTLLPLSIATAQGLKTIPVSKIHGWSRP